MKGITKSHLILNPWDILILFDTEEKQNAIQKDLINIPNIFYIIANLKSTRRRQPYDEIIYNFEKSFNKGLVKLYLALNEHKDYTYILDVYDSSEYTGKAVMSDIVYPRFEKLINNFPNLKLINCEEIEREINNLKTYLVSVDYEMNFFASPYTGTENYKARLETDTLFKSYIVYAQNKDDALVKGKKVHYDKNRKINK